MELSKTQKDILNCTDNRIAIMASAASGKTRILTEKVKKILESGVDPKKVAVITFTNMAATELRERLEHYNTNELFVGTIHSLANKFLTEYGIKTGYVLKDDKFDKLFNMIMEHQECVKNLDWILLDEAQDSDQMQFDFIFKNINPKNFFIVGDLKQSIYSFRGAEPQLFQGLLNRDDVTVFSLNENYRNGNGILDFAKKIISSSGLIDTSMSYCNYPGIVIKTKYTQQSLVNILISKNYKDWAILTRTNKDLSILSSILKKNGIPVISFKQGDLTKAELEKQMNKNAVKVLTVHSAKGLEWDNVIVYGAKYYSNEEIRIGYVAATRARKILYWM